MDDEPKCTLTKWVVGRKYKSKREIKWNFVSRFGGRTLVLSRARIYFNDGIGWGAALDAREKQGDHVYRLETLEKNSEAK